MENIDEKVTPVSEIKAKSDEPDAPEKEGEGDATCGCECDPRKGDQTALRFSAQVNIGG